MPHARKQIRDAVVAALTGATAAGANVFATRIYPLEETSLPALLVYTLEEQSAYETMGILERQLRVAVEIAAQGVAASDDAIDALSADVETLLAANAALKALVLDFVLSKTSIAKSGDGDKPTLGAVLDFACLYRTAIGNPQTIV